MLRFFKKITFLNNNKKLEQEVQELKLSVEVMKLLFLKSSVILLSGDQKIINNLRNDLLNKFKYRNCDTVECYKEKKFAYEFIESLFDKVQIENGKKLDPTQ